MSADPNEHVIEIEGLMNAIGDGQILHKDLNLKVRRDEVMTLVGESGSGKTQLLRVILGLKHPLAGAVRVFGVSWDDPSFKKVRDARRDSGKPTLVMSHALGCDASLWDALANSLAAEHRVVCYDHRGHGDSEAPHGPYTMTSLAEDADHLLAELDARYATGPVVWIGLSLGGMVGQELALAHPRRLKALVIANSTSRYDEAGRAQWAQRIAAVEAGGPEAVADGAMQRWFSPAFRAERPAAVARWRRRVATTPKAGYLGACHAVMHMDTAALLPRVALPVLVIAGALDQGTPPAMSQAIAQAIPGARLEVIDEAAHLSVLEQPAAFERAVRDFLATLA